MRIAWHCGIEKTSTRTPTRSDLLWETCETYINKVASPGTTVEMAFSRHGTLSLHPFLCSSNNLLVAEEVLALQNSGVDAVVLGSAHDPGLDEARNIVDIPVVGSIESALAFSTFLGRKAAVLTIQGADGSRTYTRAIESGAAKYGLRDRLISHKPARTYPFDNKTFWEIYTEALHGDGTRFLRSFDEMTSQMVDDGAEVIILGMQFTGALLYKLGRSLQTKEGVPCIDIVAVGVKNLESLVSLRETRGLQKSQQSVFASLPNASLELARSSLRQLAV